LARPLGRLLSTFQLLTRWSSEFGFRPLCVSAIPRQPPFFEFFSSMDIVLYSTYFDNKKNKWYVLHNMQLPVKGHADVELSVIVGGAQSRPSAY